ncbi:MAG: TetR/AcrR family transcriptional regulator [Nocardiaceae bacterium]|nr:TetR/AcrR family transcriptional regulator [Nocardiaceae bacterium]
MTTAASPMRDRILRVALELFTEHGYDGTSLREIAEKLDVTKAALYYHFKSKDAILLTLVNDWREQTMSLVEWGREQPFSAELQQEMLRRLSALLTGNHKTQRLMFENQPVIRGMVERDNAEHGRPNKYWIFEFVSVITPPDADAFTRAAVRTAVFGLSTSAMQPGNNEEDHEAALEVALQVLALKR